MSIKQSPQRLLQLLQSVTNSSKNVPRQLFRGFYNDNKIPNQDQNYCYVISFLQIFFHCPAVIDYFKTQNISNNQEKILKNIFNEIYKNNNYSAIYIDDFLLHWSGWEYHTTLPVEQSDVAEFANYLLASVSTNLSDLFLFTGNFEPSIAPFDRNYLYSVLPIGQDIEDIINTSLLKYKGFKKIPEYFIVSLVRNVDNSFREDEKPINTFILLKKDVYKCKSIIVFSGKDKQGHYKSFIKIDDEYFLFNDEFVSPLFNYPNCSSDMQNFLKLCNSEINKRSVLILYERCACNYIPRTYETIKFIVQKKNSSSANYISKIKNTLKQISKEKTKRKKSNADSDSSDSDSSDSSTSNENKKKIIN